MACRSQAVHRTGLDHDAFALAHGMDGLVLIDQDARLAGSAALIPNAPIVAMTDAAGTADQQFGFLQTLLDSIAVLIDAY